MRRGLPSLPAAGAALLAAALCWSAAVQGADRLPSPVDRPLPPPSIDGTLRPGAVGTRDEEASGDIDPERFGQRLPDDAYGAFQRGYYATAYKLALPRAANGDAAAQTLVAEILSRGLGIARDEAEAAKWYGLAAEQGVAEAQFQYALMLIDGRFVAKDVKAAYALMQAAAEAGNKFAQFNFAQLLVEREPGGRGLERAFSYYQRAADAGLADAQYAMAQYYANGVGGQRQDDARARMWLARSASQNFDTAQFDLSLWLMEGRGGPRDRAAAFSWMKRAADAGNVAAQNRVAKYYLEGLGVEPDTTAAAAWYILARRAGLFDAQMEDFFRGMTEEEMKTALERANRLR